MRDVEFLALLVHRGHLPKDRASELLPALGDEADLDALLVERLGWTPEHVARLRRSRCGEIPEIPGYQILEKVGTGGTADVFKARDLRSRRVLALKVLKPEATRDERVRRSFIGEARMLERLSHPSLVACHGVARSGSTYFSRLDFIEGKTLLELLDAGQSFREEEALRIILAVAEALLYLEENGLVHRDVKPGNIMLDGKGRVFLIDLGFAATRDSSPDPSESTMGTVQYLAPEQARGGSGADCRSDIYSMGLSLFHLVVGRLPFESSDDREVLRMQVMESLSSPELKGRTISPHLHYFIEKMVAKDAEHRYQGWGELIADVKAQLAGREDLDFEAQARRGGEPRNRP